MGRVRYKTLKKKKKNTWESLWHESSLFGIYLFKALSKTSRNDLCTLDGEKIYMRLFRHSPTRLYVVHNTGEC